MAAISGLIRVMEKAARKAGGRLRRDFGEIEHLQVSRKGPSDFVSKADQASERTIWDELRAARPDWGFLFEEGGEIEGDPNKPRFIVDPLDGTTKVCSQLFTVLLEHSEADRTCVKKEMTNLWVKMAGRHW